MPANPIGYLLRNRRAGQHTLVWARDDLQAPESFPLTSPAFDDGTAMPEVYRGRLRGENVSPPLAWSAPPAEAVELVLIAQDPDVPFGTAALHAVAVGIDPALGALPERALTHPNGTTVAGVRLGKGALGRVGWSGPLPPRSHGSHDYVFMLFAVAQPVEVPEVFGLPDVLTALSGEVVARARLTGTYENR